MFISRQFTALIAKGNVEADQFRLPVFQSYDVDPSIKPKIAAGKNSGDYITIAAAGSYSVQLPEGYDTAERLFVLIAAEGIIRCVLVSPTHATSTILIKGEDSDRPGIYSSCERVTSITLSNPTAAAVKVQISMYELPDITEAAGFSNGSYAFNGAE